jgi:uracil-DNA glycosylase family 4
MAGPNCPSTCALYDKGHGFALTDGTGISGVMLIGEALGAAEAKMSKPFCGDAGLMLGQVLHRLGYKRESFLIGNVVNCQPTSSNWLEGAPWEQDAISHCRPFFEETLRRNPQIKVLVPMGNSAMHYLLGQKGISNFHGYIQWHPGYEKWVVPTFHPSYLMRGNWNEIQTARFDLQVAVELAQKAKSQGKDAFQRQPTTHLTQPSTTAAWAYAYEFRDRWLTEPELPLASDIETPKGSPDEEDAEEDPSFEVERISFAFQGHRAISMPWEGEYIEIARWLYKLGCTHWLWNGDRFDLPRLRRQGCNPEHTLDIQELWHFIYPDLPKKLGYVAPFFTDAAPWKHLKGVDEPFYSCEDSARLWGIGQALVSKVKAAGRWASFEREIMECNRRTAQMSRTGIAIDEPVRVEMVATEEAAAAHVHVEVQDLVPRELKPVHPKGGYKRPSPEGRCPSGHKLSETCDQCAATQGWKPEHLQAEGLRQIEVDDMAVIEGRQQVAKFLRWAKVEEFNIGSGQQLIRYIEFKLGKSAVPKAKRTGKPTVERDQLERLAKKSGDPVLLLACQASEIQARVVHLNGWAPGADGKVHAVFTNQPATFRLAAKAPNVFNFPTRSEAAHAMRRMVVPGEGYQWIVSRDYSGIEAIQVGIYAGDPDYERLAKFGIHTFMAARKAGLSIESTWPDDQLQAALKEYKKVTQSMRLNGAGSSNLYDAMKRGNHMTNYGATAGMLQASYPDVFPSRKAAQLTQDFIFDLFPRVKKWQDAVVDRAHREAVLVNDFGYPRWFWFVKKPVKRASGWTWDRAEDAKAAIATLPQSSAAIILRRALTSEPASALLDAGKLFLTIHDELIARAVDEDDAEQVSEKLRLAMEFSVAEQGGRVFRTAAKKGRDWSEVE